MMSWFKKIENPNWPVLTFAVLLLASVFALDLAIPLGVAGGVPYMAAVLLTLWASRRATLAIAVLASTLTILGFFFSPAGGELWQVLINRFLALFAIWVTTVLIILRRRMEQDLYFSTQKVAQHIEQSPLAFIEWNKNFEVTQWNRAAATIFGFSESEAIGRCVRDLVLPADVVAQLEKFWQYPLAPDGGSYSLNENTTKDGRRITTEWFYTHLIDEKGEVIGVASLIHDITKRVQAEAALRDASELNEKIIAESPIGIAIYNHSGKCITANASVAEMIGATQEQVLAINYNNIESWKQSGLLDAANKCMRLQKTERIEIDVLSSFGKQACYDCLFVPFTLRGQQHLLLMFDDISERRVAAKALEESEARLEKAQAMAQIGHWNLDAETNEFTGSNFLYSLFGLEIEESFVDNFIAIIHPDDRDRAAFVLPHAMETGEGWDIEYRIVLKDGLKKWVQSVGEVISDENGKVVEMVGTVQDITERKQAEAAIRRSLAEKEVLLKEIHHRVKNNLQIITSLLHLQAEGINDQAAISLLEESRSRVQAMALLHENLYNAEDLATIDTREYVTKLTSYLCQTYNGSGRGFELLTKVDDLHLDIDTAIPLGLVINELVSNAFK
ncbi:MAG: PAS domain S-box protein, partial [Candidatus Marinimicrobia bacterium]|nr:PAS domain S-box protein [Candidatus Neomarinimicrobiota bacterium]